MTTENEWIELPTLQDVAKAQADGMEIEMQTDPGNDKYFPWKTWDQQRWHTGYLFRARPAQPKMKKVTMLCYTNEITIDWKNESLEVDEDLWIRVPEQDIEIEIPEGV